MLSPSTWLRACPEQSEGVNFAKLARPPEADKPLAGIPYRLCVRGRGFLRLRSGQVFTRGVYPEPFARVILSPFASVTRSAAKGLAPAQGKLREGSWWRALGKLREGLVQNDTQTVSASH